MDSLAERVFASPLGGSMCASSSRYGGVTLAELPGTFPVAGGTKLRGDSFQTLVVVMLPLRPTMSELSGVSLRE